MPRPDPDWPNARISAADGIFRMHRSPNPGFPVPVLSKTVPVPANHGFRLHDGQGIQAAGPQTIEPDLKYPVEGCEPRPPVLLSLKDGQLVAQGENLELKLGTGPKPVSSDHGQKS